MKMTFLRSKWFRNFRWLALSLVSVICLFYAAFNWYGARLKQDAVARMRTAGVLVSADELIPSMPPNDQNFAMIPILRENAPESPAAYQPELNSPWSPRGRRMALYDPAFELLGKGAPEPDFSRMPKEAPYGRTAAEFLAAYDRLNGSALQELREGMAKPLVRRPLYLGTVPGRYQLGDGDKLSAEMWRITRGISFRSWAALQSGDIPRFVESIEIGLRLAEFTGSRGTALSLGYAPHCFETALKALKTGQQRHCFSDQDLVMLQREIGRTDFRNRSRDALRLEVLQFQRWAAWKEDPQQYREEMERFWMGPNADHWTEEHAWILPGGYFDSLAAQWADGLGRLERAVATEIPLAKWWESTKTVESDPNKRQSWQMELMDAKMVVWIGVRASVVQSQAILACELERYRLAHGEYPDTLDALNNRKLTIDPLTGDAFHYRRKPDGFLMYSIGSDGIDQGGDGAGTNGWIDGDWVW
jgi:hypothetical protein